MKIPLKFTESSVSSKVSFDSSDWCIDIPSVLFERWVSSSVCKKYINCQNCHDVVYFMFQKNEHKNIENKDFSSHFLYIVGG